MYLFLIPLLSGFAFNSASAFTAFYSRRLGERGGRWVSILLRDVVGIPVWVNSTLSWLIGDHLGSTSITTAENGGNQGSQLYYAWGETRWSSGSLPTSYQYTGQRLESSIGLCFYGARWYDPYLNRWIQPDSIIPNPTNSQDLDRYSYDRNNPVKYVDPNGHWLETVLDIAFIAFDIQQIVQEGWTPANTAALVADLACAIVPFGTAGGPALRAAMAGGEATITVAQTSIHVPEIIRVGQGTAKVIQYIEGSSTNGDELPGSNIEITNSTGDPYPEIIDPRTNQPIPAPTGNLQLKPPNQRVSWNLEDGANFIREWHEKGYADPTGGWELYDIHHIIPREYGGTNDFDNLVPVLRDVHQQQLNAWWTHYR